MKRHDNDDENASEESGRAREKETLCLVSGRWTAGKQQKNMNNEITKINIDIVKDVKHVSILHTRTQYDDVGSAIFPSTTSSLVLVAFSSRLSSNHKRCKRSFFIVAIASATNNEKILWCGRFYLVSPRVFHRSTTSIRSSGHTEWKPISAAFNISYYFVIIFHRLFSRHLLWTKTSSFALQCCLSSIGHINWLKQYPMRSIACEIPATSPTDHQRQFNFILADSLGIKTYMRCNRPNEEKSDQAQQYNDFYRVNGVDGWINRGGENNNNNSMQSKQVEWTWVKATKRKIRWHFVWERERARAWVWRTRKKCKATKRNNQTLEQNK